MPTPTRALRPLRIGPAPADVAAALPALAAALDGSGPAVLPTPSDLGQSARLLEALRPDQPVEPRDVAVVVGTTGSTGEPKGALLPAAALASSADGTVDRLGGPGQWLLALPAYHVAGLQVLVRSVLAGTDPVVLDRSGAFTAPAFVAATDRLTGGRRYTSLVPTQLTRLLDAGAPAGAVAALATYDAVLVGGAAAPDGLLDRARDAGVRAVATYGMTETCGGCVYDGFPLAGVRVRVGDDGRIRLAGDVLFAGYRLRPDLTAAAVEDGWLVTDDLGRFDPAGRLTVLGRVDDVAVSGGEKVALPRVEAALTAHRGVRAAAAVAVADPEWGQRVVAVIVPTEPAPAAEELRGWVTARLGPAAAPRQVIVVAELPLAGPGKVDRRAVQDLAVPDVVGQRRASGPGADRSATGSSASR